MRAALFVWWIALIGADRIDLLGGAAPLRLTPFLVLTPVLLAVESLRLMRRRLTLTVPKAAGGYTIAVSLLLVVTLISVFVSYDIGLSAQRTALLLFQVYTTFAIAILLAQDPDRDRILVRGAYGGIALAAIFNIAQMVFWLRGLAGEGDGSQIDAFVFVAPWAYGSFLPRLSGQVLDMNRAGLLLVIYMFLLLRFGMVSRARTLFLSLAAMLVLVTLSRSAVAAMLAMGMIIFLQTRKARVNPRTLFYGATGAALVLAALIVIPDLRMTSVDTLLPPLLLRVLGDGSSSVHFDLIRHGFETATASVQNALFGIGFGSAHTVLGQFFPDNEYANFHSLYVSLLAETGIFALCLGLLLLLVPFFASSRYRPLIGAFLVFSVFYQSTLEPVFWFMLAAAWLELRPVQKAGWSRRITPEYAGA